MRFYYFGPAEPIEGQQRWHWILRGWPDGHDSGWLFGLRDHQCMAIAAIWRHVHGGRK